MPSFVEISPVVPEKKNFEGFLSYNIYIFIAIAPDESIFLDVLHFPMKSIMSRGLEATPMGGLTSKLIH